MRGAMLALAVMTAGCSGVDYAASTYRGIDVERFASGGQTWRIFDKPDDGRMMITPTLLRAARQGFFSGLTFGALDTDIPKPRYQGAVDGWLVQTGREGCTVTDGYEIIFPQWEFTYSCPTSTSGAPAPRATPMRQPGGAFPPVTSSGTR